jgi:6-phosphogluconolactonase
MTETDTTLGRLVVGEAEDLFERLAALAAGDQAAGRSRHFTWALSGGGTPRDFCRWAIDTGAIPKALAADAHFTVSDERHVPLSDAQSNFGQAERLLLEPLRVPRAHRHPWVVAYPPEQAAEAYRRTWLILGGPGRAYDLCVLGLGDDAHTASLFPGSPLLAEDGGLLFAAVDTGIRGWRLTITPAGLRACGRVVVLAMGPGKAAAVRRVFRGDEPVAAVPAKVLAACASRVTWLLDPAAASAL